MKIILNYDQATGQVTDNIGAYVGSLLNLSFDNPEDKKTVDVNQLIKLKEAGFTVDEIVTMSDKAII